MTNFNSLSYLYSLMNEINEYPTTAAQSNASYMLESKEEQEAYRMKHQQALAEWQTYITWLES